MKFFKAFREFRIRLVFLLCVFIIPAVMLPTLIISNIYMNTMQRQNEKTTLAGFAEAENQIETLLRRAQRATVSIQKYPEVDRYLFSSFAGDVDRVEAKRDIINAIKSAFASYDFLNAIIFFKSDGSMCGTSEPWTYFFESYQHPFVVTDEYRKQALNASSTTTWPGGYTLNYFTKYTPSPTQLLTANDLMICGFKTLVYKFSTKEESDIVMVLFSITEPAVRDCYSNLSADNGNVYLLDRKGAQLSGENTSLFGRIPSFYTQIESEKLYGSTTMAEEGNNFQVIYYRLSLTGWTLVKTIPLSIYRSNANYLSMMALAIGMSTLIVMFCLYAVWASRFTHPFRHIEASLRRVQDGDLSVRMNENSSIHEFQLINRQFNQMLNSINELIKKNQCMEREKLVLEMRTLQAQINPHFIYNTIATIRWMATISGARNVSDMLIVLTELLRPVFAEWALEWTMEKELSFIHHYMKLMKLRYGMFFDFTMDIPPVLNELAVPRFFLQPLLENCCEHGIQPDRAIHVSLKATCCDGEIVLLVDDDGRGITTERLAEIRNSLEGKPVMPSGQDHANVGLVNVHRRIQLYYGEKYGLSIESILGKGTRLRIHLPDKVSSSMLSSV